jgi:large subunit ribosomal protein L24
MRIKKDDTVVIIAGEDKNSDPSKVIKVIPKANKIIVENRNVKTKHQKQTQKAAAEIKHIEAPIDVSNVMYYDKKTKQPTKIGYRMEGDRKVRYAKKTGEVID